MTNIDKFFKLNGFFSFLALLFATVSCQSQDALSPLEFSKMISETPNSQIIDVRTPEEFEQGHLINAQNIDFFAPNFTQLLSSLDKNKTIFVYCLSGGRSQKAAKSLHSLGYSKVYELDGGILKWRKENLPEETESGGSGDGLSKSQYEQLQNNDKTVLINFFAKWCAPCKKMEPFIENISDEMNATVEVVRIDADANKLLLKELGISALPVLQVFKNKSLVWSNVGYATKAQIMKHLR